MNDNYRIVCSIDSLNSINIINQKSDICLNDKEYIMSTDSRFVEKNDIFLALKGRYSDGHNFLSQAFNNGASVAIISEKKIVRDISALKVRHAVSKLTIYRAFYIYI